MVVSEMIGGMEAEVPRKAISKKTKAKSKAKGAADKPKRAMSAFMFFSLEQRPAMKAEHPEATFGELGKMLGQRWREMDDDEKAKYVQKNAVDKARYQAQVDAAPKKAKRPMSAFMLFCNAHRNEVKQANPELSFGETGKLLGQMWREAAEEQKQEFVQKAAELKAEYQMTQQKKPEVVPQIEESEDEEQGMGEDDESEMDDDESDEDDD